MGVKQQRPSPGAALPSVVSGRKGGTIAVSDRSIIVRQFRSSRFRQLTPALLTGIVAGSCLAFSAGPASAAKSEGKSAAKTVAAEAPAPTLYVLAFHNNTKYQDVDLGHMLSRSFSHGLEKTGGRTVIPDARLHEAVADLKLEAPFDRIARAQIAGKVEADQVLYGNISTALITAAPKAKAFIRVMVMVEFVDKGVFKDKTAVQALSVEGNSEVHATAVSNEILLQEAIDDAANRLSQFAASTRAWGATAASQPYDVASNAPTAGPAAGPGAPPPGVSALPTVTAKSVSDTVQPPPPVVVDAPGIDRDEGTAKRRRQIIATKTLRTLVGGIMLLGLLWLAGTGPMAFGF
jgi:hypothetical protein